MSNNRVLYLLSIALWVVIATSVVISFLPKSTEDVAVMETEEWPPIVEDCEGEDPYESERIEQAIINLPDKRYELTDEEFYLVNGIVMAEAGGETYEGKMAVAQTILNNCERTGSRPADVAWMYADPADTWTDEVWLAVTAVFFEGWTVTDEKICWFYAPALCTSDWHESQRFVMEIGGHRFFAAHE